MGMKACMEDATDASARKACATNVAKDALKKTSLDGAVPSDEKVKLFLKKGAQEAVKSIRSSCNNTKSLACKNTVKNAIASSLGKQPGDLKEIEIARIVRKSSLENAVEEARACAQARKDKGSSATCKEPIDSFVEIAGESKPAGKLLDTEKMRVKKNALKAAMAETKLVCLDEPDKAAVQSCLQEATSDLEDISGVLLEGAKKVKEKKLQAEKRATIAVMGESVRSCMEAASEKSSGVAAAKTACIDEAKTKLQKLDEKEPVKNVLKKFRANIMAGVKDCDGDKKTCRAEAKAEAIASGMEAHEYQQTKRIAEIKSSAETFSDCKDGGVSDSDCGEQAKETFLDISGTTAAQYPNVKDKVETLGKQLADGAITQLILQDSVAVAAYTSGTGCNDGAKDDFSKIVGEKATTANNKLGVVAKSECRVVDGNAEYSTTVATKGMSADEIDTASKTMATSLASASISTSRRRRLLGSITATEVYASQETEICTEGDSSCDGSSQPATTSKGDVHIAMSIYTVLACMASCALFLF